MSSTAWQAQKGKENILFGFVYVSSKIYLTYDLNLHFFHIILLIMMFRIRFTRYPKMEFFPLAHNAVVTSAIFAPNPSLMLSPDVQSEKLEGHEKSEDAEALDTMPFGKYSKSVLSTFFFIST